MNLIDESVKKIDEMSSLAKHRTLLAAKSEFDRIAVQRKIIDQTSKGFAERGCGEFYFIDKYVIYEALRKDETWFGIYEIEKDKVRTEFYDTLPHALIALAAIDGGGDENGVTYAARVLFIKDRA